MKDKSDVLVSIRLPIALIDELTIVQRKKHFMTLSEAIRSILRENYVKSSNADELSETEKRLVDELRKLRERLNEPK